MADEPDMKKLLEEALLEQKEAFRKKFGRDPRPGDPILFDPDNNSPEPVALTEGKLTKGILEAMKTAQVPPEIVYAYKRTGLLISESLKDTYDPDLVAEWAAAIDEYYENTEIEGEPDGDDWASLNDFAFEGETVGEITIRLAGKEVTRPIKLSWKHTPEWEHFDERKRELVALDQSREAWILRNQILTDPSDSNYDPNPERSSPRADWENLDLLQPGILGTAIEDAFEDDVMRQCKKTDRERRKQVK